MIGLTVEKAKKAGLLGKGLNPMPREMSFPAQRGENWNDLYDFIRWVGFYSVSGVHISYKWSEKLSMEFVSRSFLSNKILSLRFPNDSTKKPFDSIQFPDDPETRQGQSTNHVQNDSLRENYYGKMSGHGF